MGDGELSKCENPSNMLTVVTYLDSIDTNRLQAQRSQVSAWVNVQNAVVLTEFQDVFLRRERLTNLVFAINTCMMENAGLLVANTKFLFSSGKFLKQTRESGIPVFSADIARLRKLEPEIAATFWRVCEDIADMKSNSLSLTARTQAMNRARRQELLKTHSISLGDQIYNSIALGESSADLAERWNDEGRQDIDGQPFSEARIERMKEILEGALSGDARW